MPKLIEVNPLERFHLRVKYSDGVEGVADLSKFAGKGVFALWNDYSEFQKAHIGSSGEIAWNDEVDMDADAIYLQITGNKPKDIFAKLKELNLPA
ncbi:MAG: DUF2442 domain-containing protein [Chloroflexi bacterium]|nr:DUF2442 domain-containing protein [Chloroflexota bacterium]MBI3740138.1 DUF2442 domain-containing protein [Chloroflexota bacterium]